MATPYVSKEEPIINSPQYFAERALASTALIKEQGGL